MPRRYPEPEEDLSRQPWTADDLLAMQNSFAAAMRAAGYALTVPSSKPGTEAPIVGYRRIDT